MLRLGNGRGVVYQRFGSEALAKAGTGCCWDSKFRIEQALLVCVSMLVLGSESKEGLV